jgi:hypothetical protein
MNKKTKFVTCFYAYHANKPFWATNGRQDRYLYSMVTLCNMKEQIVCYTDEGDLGYNQLKKIKDEYQLNNLEIKVYSLIDNPYQERVYKIRTSNPEFYDNPEILNYGRSPQIYWMKYDFLLAECEPDINLYWIDMGLSCEGLFPPHLAEYGHEEDYVNYYRNSGDYQLHKHKFYAFPAVFNENTVLKINEYVGDKLIHIHRYGVTDCNHNEFNRVIKEDVNYSDGIYPIGGFLGGNSNYIPQIVAEAKRCIDLILEDNYYLCGDEEINAYLQVKYKELYKTWMCHTFYHEGYPNIWNESMIPFHRFFSEK